MVPKNIDLSINFAGIPLKNPVMVASGTFGYGEEYARHFKLDLLGAIVVKSLTLAPRQGNPPPRTVETAAGMLNAIGLQNVGVDTFIKDKLPFLRKFKVPVIVNIAGSTVEEYRELAQRLEGVKGIAGLEINVSCPNVKQGGLAFGTNPQATAEVTAAVKKVTRLPVIVKLTPNVTDIVVIAQAAEAAGADALSLINTLLGMAVDPKTRRPYLTYVTGGLSGPAIKPVALRMVWQVAQKVKIPVVGMGGIVTGEDAAEFLMAGASAVAVGTATFLDPLAAPKVVEGLRAYLHRQGMKSVRELIGSMKT